MIKYHPDENLLLEYASGGLAQALSLSVCAHLQMCTECTKRVKELQVIGGAIFSKSLVEPVAEKTFDELMARIDQSADVVDSSSDSAASDARDSFVKDAFIKDSLHYDAANAHLLSDLPKVIRKLLPTGKKLRWRGAFGPLRTARLETGQQEYEVAFQKITSGGTSVHHGHQGIEVTLVLHGSFSDEDGVYSRGDFLVRNSGEIHKPTATQNEDCLCLSVAAAPVVVTGLLGKIVNPFLSFKPQ